MGCRTRILIASYRYPPVARASNLLQGLAEGLAERGHAVKVVTKLPVEYLPAGGIDEVIRIVPREVVNGVEVVRVRGLPGIRRSVPIRALEQMVAAVAFGFAVLRAPRPHVVLTLTPPFPIALAVALVAKLRGLRCVLTLHDLYPRTAVELALIRSRVLIWILERMERLLYSWVGAIVVPMPGHVDYLSRYHGRRGSDVRLVHNWADVSRRRPGARDNGFRRREQLGDRLVVSYAGVMGVAQDLGAALECARRLRDRPDVVFLLVGDGPLKSQWRAEAAGLPNVRFLPSVNEDAYFELLRASDVCLVPLTAKLASPAIPGKIQSIMSVSRPILASVPVDGDAAEVIRESQCGFVVSPDAVDEFQARLEELLASAKLRSELGSRGRAFAERRFSLEAALDAYEEVLCSALASPNHPWEPGS